MANNNPNNNNPHRQNWHSQAEFQHIVDMAKHNPPPTLHARRAPPSPGPTQPSTSRKPNTTNGNDGRLAVSSPKGLHSERSLTPFSDALSDVSRDSFDWIGDDFQTQEDPSDELFFESLDGHGSGGSGGGGDGSLTNIIPMNIINNILLIIFILCMLIFLASLFNIPMGEYGNVSLEMWVLMTFLTIFTPVWINTAILKTSTFLRTIPLISKTEIPAMLEAVHYSLAIMTSSLIVGSIWMAFYPSQCSTNIFSTYQMFVSSATTATANAGNTDDLTDDPLDPICYYSYMARIFFFLFTSGLLMSLSTLLMTNIRSNFQERTFKSRIIASRFKVYVVDQLLAAAKREKMARETAASSLRSHSSTSSAKVVMQEFMFNIPFIIPEYLWRWWRKFWRRSTPYIRLSRDTAPTTGGLSNGASPAMSAADDFVEFRKAIIQTIQTAGYESVANAPPRTDYDAKRMARMIFHYLCPSHRKFLVHDDFASIIAQETACNDAYFTFDNDHDGTITKAEFRGAIVRIFREQRNLMQSVKNTGNVLSILDTMSTVVVSIALFLLLLSLLGMQVSNILAVTASVMFGLNFIIYDAANKTFHSILFLFVQHPFDIGDKIVVGEEGAYQDQDVLTVLDINVQNTIFNRWNGMQVSKPNHVLATSTLTNLSRSSEQWERVEFDLHAPDKHGLTVEEETAKLSELRKRIDAFVRQYPTDYYKAFELKAFVAADIAKADKNLDTIRFLLKIRCRETLDAEKKWARHARILAFVKQAVSSVGVDFADTK